MDLMARKNVTHKLPQTTTTDHRLPYINTKDQHFAYLNLNLATSVPGIHKGKRERNGAKMG